ncbi:DUF4232 domain-containing protein [Streptomyces sp. NPDC002932]|uniref:DUF4232 domain-containing protein n=1 Tax=Streptomyces sp. NPDC002932 TaxID=3364672 RepID=UPI0036A689C5
MRARKLTFAALALAAGLSLTACQNDDDAVGQADPSSGSSASAASSSGGGSDSGGTDEAGGKESPAPDSAGSASGGGSTSGGSGSGSDAKGGKCTTDGLKVTALNTFIDGDRDGSIAVALTNTSGADCVISGFVGVDLKTNAGTISATRKGDPGDPYTLKNGKEIDSNVNYPLNKTGGSGVRITGLVVTPPNETKSVTIAWPGESSLPAGDSGNGDQVLVGPIGSAGQGG